MANNTASQSLFARFKVILFGPSRVYIVEYIMLHLVMLGLAFSASKLLSYLFHAPEPGLAYNSDFSYSPSLFPVPTYQPVIAMIALAVVLTPLFGLLYLRIRKSERAHQALTDNRRRRFVTYVYLSLTAIAVVVLAVMLVYSVILYFTSSDPASTSDYAKDLAQLVFAIGFLKLTMYLSYRLVRKSTLEVA